MANHIHVIGDVPHGVTQLHADVEDILLNPIFRGALTSRINADRSIDIMARGDEEQVFAPLRITLWLGASEETGEVRRCVTIRHGHALHLGWFFDDAIAKLLAIRYGALLFDDGFGQIKAEPPIDRYPYAGKRSLRLLDGVELQGHRALRQFLDESRGLVV